MEAGFSRRAFVIGAPVCLGALPRLTFGCEGIAQPEAVGTEFPRAEAALVRDIVGASHGNMEKVKELTELRPALANSCWDWGFGDFETALGAAAHTGRREIAEYLISKGARVDIFAAAMLGWTPVVKGMVEARPGIQKTLGPHGLTLMHHAKAGKEKATATVAYLVSVGDADTPTPTQPLAEAERDRLIGTYAWGSGESDKLVVSVEGQLGVLRPGGTRRGLAHVGKLEFFPAGAPAVRLRFTGTGGAIDTLSVVDGKELVVAKRV